MKHKTKKLGEFYTYREFLIKKWDNNYLNDPEIRGVQWNVYWNMEDYHCGSSLDIVSTLKEAKQFIDRAAEMRAA